MFVSRPVVVKALAVLAAVALVSALGVQPVSATSSKPSTAPVARVGVPYLGNTDHCGAAELYVACHADLWRIPALLTSDIVTIAWKHTSALRGPKMCITAGVDDFSWADNRCNSSLDVNGIVGAYGSAAGKRTVFTVPRSASPAYLTFYDSDCFGPCGYYGGYEFTVEKIQHRVLVALPALTAIGRTSGLAVRPRLANSAVIPGQIFALQIIVNGVTLTRYAKTAANGVALFSLGLPLNTRGKLARFRVYKTATTTLQATSSAAVRMLIR
jgi:hypothetical protein